MQLSATLLAVKVSFALRACNSIRVCSASTAAASDGLERRARTQEVNIYKVVHSLVEIIPVTQISLEKVPTACRRALGTPRQSCNVDHDRTKVPTCDT